MEARPTIGQRVKAHREAAGLTREQLAEQVGRSAKWLRSVELGNRRLDRYTMIQALAEALHADLADLLGRPRPGGDPHLLAAYRTLPALRHALYGPQFGPHAGPHAEPLAPASAAPPSVDELRRRVDETDRLRRDARYGELGDRLPALLTELGGAAALLDGVERDVAYRLLTEARHNAAVLAKKLGHTDLAALAAGQAREAAAAAGDPLLVLAAQWLQAEVCLAAGFGPQARALIADALDRTDGLLGEAASGADARAGSRMWAGSGAWSIWGTLHLVAAVLEAQRGRQPESAGHLADARAALERIGGPDTEHTGHQTEFSAGNHAIHLVHAALELGEDLEALDRIAGVDLSRLPRERRARHGIDRARARARAGDDEGAMRELLAADRISPQTVRCHPLARETVAAAAPRGRTGGPVAEAARRLGLDL
ncbi:helix-turn-helix transcriptional regulator [Kitasatospora sp. NPDC048540]|uniref:helix-turn-helix transcriptional regulator n=1 Tax=Kitasatospora sp. NPDC048540 TaxID=3155634 RepID=UPI00340201CA